MMLLFARARLLWPVMLLAAILSGPAMAAASDVPAETVVTLLGDDVPASAVAPAGSIAIQRSEPTTSSAPPAKIVRAPQRPADRIVAAPVGAAAAARVPDIRISPGETTFALRAVVGLTVLAVLPAMLICLTAFLRIIIVLSMLRHAMGMPETPPNTALIGLALFLTLFTMAPVLQTVNADSVQPFMQGRISMQQAYERASGPMREFMVRQTREQDLALMVELSKAKKPETMDDISNVQLVPAFMLSELRAAFQIGFVVFLPFLLIDLIVSSILMALGMMMMPPMTIALPLKILMFILIDGWSVLLKALVGSFH